MKLIITRPEQDSVTLARKLSDMGHEAVVVPLLEIVAHSKIEIPDKPFAAILVTSANGVRCLPAGAVSHSVRVIAIGAQSAEAARARGFHTVESHGGDVEHLAAWIVEHLSPASGSLLYVTGKDISGDLAGVLLQHGFEVHRVETYQAQAKPLTLSLQDIAGCDGVLLYSPRSAKLWLGEAKLQGLNSAVALLRHYCLSPAIAHVLPHYWPISVASQPTDRALLQLLERANKEA